MLQELASYGFPHLVTWSGKTSEEKEDRFIFCFLVALVHAIRLSFLFFSRLDQQIARSSSTVLVEEPDGWMSPENLNLGAYRQNSKAEIARFEKKKGQAVRQESWQEIESESLLLGKAVTTRRVPES